MDRLRIAALLAAPLLLAAGCSGSSASPAPAPTADGGSGGGQGGSSASAYPDSGSLLGALKTAGAACVQSSGKPNDVGMPGLRSSLNCTVSAAGGAGSSDVTVAVFDNHADAQGFASMMTSSNVSGMLIGGTTERVVLGQNWVVLVPDDAAYAQRVGTLLGGTVLSVGTASASTS